MGFSCLLHNFFGFDFYFLLKGIRISCWEIKDIKVGRTNLTNINFASIGSQEKFIDTMKSTKCFQTSLAQLASTLTEEENESIKKLTIQSIIPHDYFFWFFENSFCS